MDTYPHDSAVIRGIQGGFDVGVRIEEEVTVVEDDAGPSSCEYFLKGIFNLKFATFCHKNCQILQIKFSFQSLFRSRRPRILNRSKDAHKND